MKLTSILFIVFRALLGLFGIGQGNCLYYPSCSNQIRKSMQEKGFVMTIPLVFERAYKCNPLYRKFGKNWQ
jgi:putative component of membrane protein insertase Oxa1/YidC/SpoIIIJ protein YidD